MAGLYKSFKTNESLEKNGIRATVGYTEDNKEIVLILARAGGTNTKFLSTLNAKLKPHMRNGVIVNLDPRTNRDIMKQVFAETVVKGWENVTDENDQPFPFNEANCLKLFRDLDDLFGDVAAAANDAALYRSAALEEQAKN